MTRPSKMHEDGVRIVQNHTSFLQRPLGSGVKRKNSMKGQLAQRCLEWHQAKGWDEEMPTAEDYLNEYTKCTVNPDLWGITDVDTERAQHYVGLLVFAEIVNTNKVPHHKLDILGYWSYDLDDLMSYDFELRVYSCSGILVESFTDHELEYFTMFCKTPLEKDDYRVRLAKEKDLLGPIAGVRSPA